MLVSKKGKLKKNKSKSKKQRTFNSSEFSLLEEQRHTSMSQLFRNDALKRRQPPPVPTAVPVKKIRSQKQLQTTKKRTKSRSKGRLDKCQTYEVIPYKNSLNSEIVFSNQETKREGSMDQSSAELAIRVNQQFLLDNNRQLRISIKRQYQKKVQAAIKIQKVFRGFLTRKVLQHCLQKEQKKLQEKLAQIRSQSVSEHSSYFAQKQNNHIQPRRKFNLDQQGIFQYSNPLNLEDSEEEQDQQHAIYRHHEPIYSQQEISGYLQSSEEEDDFDQDAFDNHIIFETNEEYIDSRKSSLQQQQPKNKLSRPGNPDPIAQEPLETLPIVSPEDQNLVKTEKKQERNKSKHEFQQEVKDKTLKLKQQHEKRSRHVFLQPQSDNSLLRQQEKSIQNEGQQDDDLERLKNQQLQRWDEIISLVQSQITKSQQDNIRANDFMQQIMELSIKNKKTLQMSSKLNSPLKHVLSDHSLPRHDSKGKIKILKTERMYLTNQQSLTKETIQRQEQISLQKDAQEREKGFKKLDKILFFEDAPAKEEQRSNAAPNPTSPMSSFENTGHLKRFISGNIHDDSIQQMLKLREELMKKREVEDMKRLNIDLESKNIDQETFIKRLQSINNKYQEDKNAIERAKQDISRGYRAALRLTKEAVKDAKKLGFNLPVSRSVEGIKYKSPLLNDIIVDQLTIRYEDRPRKFESLLSGHRQPEQRIHVDVPSDESSSDLQFTQQQLRRFRRAQPYDIQLAEQIADLGRNVMISEQLLRQQQAEQENQLMVTQHVFRQIYQIEEATPPKSSLNTDQLTDWVTNLLIWEVAGDFMLRPLFSERLIDKNHFNRPMLIADKQRLNFISLLQKNFPSKQILNAKLNQKICPHPSQLLRCMRIDFSQQDDDENSYQQIGKYEFIIGQDICNQAIRQFKQQIDLVCPPVIQNTQQIDKLSKQFSFNEKLLRYLQQRQKYIFNRRNHTRQLRWEVLNIEIHCIFDAWNEQLIHLRSQKAGYSGIGLNQLTLSVRDHNWQVTEEQTLSIIAQGKERLIHTLSLSSPSLIFPKIVEEEDEDLLDQDSKWIFYADEALSYGLQLVYLVEEDIFTEVAKDLRKRMLQFS